MHELHVLSLEIDYALLAALGAAVCRSVDDKKVHGLTLDTTLIAWS
jgi:hypothetical protein